MNSIEDRVVITKPVVGICYMQVCAKKDATDEEILSVCNSQNPSGTHNGWCHVIRDGKVGIKPVTCADDKSRKHFMVEC